MQSQAKKQKKQELVFKPYQKGRPWEKTVPRKALKILLYYVICLFVFLLLGTVFSAVTGVWAWIANLAVVAAAGALMYMDGAREGESQVALGEIIHTRLENGKDVSADEKAKCFLPVKGVVIMLCGAAPLVLIALVYALMAKKQVYELQVLPEWVTAQGADSEVMKPLLYYQQTGGLQAADVLRMIVRVAVFPFAQIARLYGADGLLTMDRISPLLVIVPALGYPLGYLTGPKSRAMVHGSIKRSNTRYQRRQRKAVRARQKQRVEKKNELI